MTQNSKTLCEKNKLNIRIKLNYLFSLLVPTFNSLCIIHTKYKANSFSDFGYGFQKQMVWDKRAIEN